MLTTHAETNKICTILKIVKINPVESGIAKVSNKPYEWHKAECFLLDEAGEFSGVGKLNFPRALRETLGGVPPMGTYRAVISLVASEGEIKPQIANLVPITF